MKGITFGHYHSYRDFHLILGSKTIGTPETKTERIEIPGGDGELDFTEFFGEPKYKNRQLSFEFSTMVPESEFMTTFSKVQNALHGRKMMISLDDDPGWYYIGRITISEWKADRNIGKLTIDCNCEPYKMQSSPTVISVAVAGTQVITLPNSRKRVVPEVRIEAGASLNIVFGLGNVWDLGSGSYTLPELELAAGDNTVTVTGTGTITFTYQQAQL